MNIEFVTLEEVIAAARLQYASLVPESAGYIVLGIGQSMGEAPAVVEGPRVSLSTEGSVLLAEPRCSGTAAEACASVRRLFELMLRVSQGWMPALQAVAADAGNQDLQRLLGNTARALIPINRGAAKRAIARLARETARARQRGWLEGERANGEPEAAVARAEAGVQTPLAGTTPPPTATAARAARDGPAARAIPSFAEPCVPAAWSPTPSPAAAADPDWSSAPAPVASLSPTPAPSREPTPTVAEAICAPAQPSQPLRAPVPPAAEQWCIPPTPQPDVAHQAPRRWDDPLDETSGPLPRRAAAAAADVPKPAHEPAPLVPEPIIAIGGSAPAASPAPGADATEDHGAEPAVPEPSAPEHEIEDDTGTLLGLGPVAVSREPAAGSLAPASSTAAGDSDGSSARAAAERTPAGVNRLAQRAERGRAAPPGDRTGTTARRAAASAKRGNGVSGSSASEAAADSNAGEDEAPEPSGPGAGSMEPTALPVEPAMVHEAHVGGAGADGVAARSPAAGGDEPPAPQVDADTARVEGGEPAALPTGGLVEPGGAPDGAAASPEACPVAGPGLKGGLPSAPGLLGPSSAEELLERFGHRPGADPIDAAARALRCFSEADSAPAPPSAAGEELSVPLELVRPSGAAARSKLEGGHPEAAQSVSPVPVPCGADLGSIPPQSLVPRAARAPARRRRIPRSVVASAAMLVFGLACVATLWTSRPQIFARRTGPAASATADPCRAPLQLLDLPAPHEVWLLLGKTPLTTPPLPRGVRLELVATAAGHAAQRLVVPPDAPWKSEGRAALLKLVAALEPGGDTAWPPAPPGAVGGSGRAGIIEVTSTPEPAEIWLVVAAGPSGSDAVELGCERAAELLALSPAQPQVRRRFVVGLPELRAAAAAGGAPVSAAR